MNEIAEKKFQDNNHLYDNAIHLMFVDFYALEGFWQVLLNNEYLRGYDHRISYIETTFGKEACPAFFIKIPEKNNELQTMIHFYISNIKSIKAEHNNGITKIVITLQDNLIITLKRYGNFFSTFENEINKIIEKNNL